MERATRQYLAAADEHKTERHIWKDPFETQFTNVSSSARDLHQSVCALRVDEEMFVNCI